jgi:hypothetical protein
MPVRDNELNINTKNYKIKNDEKINVRSLCGYRSSRFHILRQFYSEGQPEE